MALHLRLTSSLEKMFHQKTITEVKQLTTASMLTNETFSFQAQYFLPSQERKTRRTLQWSVEGELLPWLQVYQVTSVPGHLPCYNTVDDHYLTTEPGLFPDLLMPLTAPTVQVTCNYQGALWLCLTPPAEGLPPGEYPLTLRLHDEAESSVMSEATLVVTVLPASLPVQQLYHTEWIHTDCLANYYQLTVFSEEYWQAVRQFVQSAVAHGVNMMLTPLFTPPLDTAPGTVRTEVQLIDVFDDGQGGYRFGFERLARWVDLCRHEGIRDFEIAHFFTQWGAAHAPHIAVQLPDGRREARFGWHTDAFGPQWRHFLSTFLPQLTAWFDQQGLRDRVWFHISDEPNEQHLENYRKASDLLRPLISGYRTLDALSDYDFYRLGLVEKPVTASDHLEPFLENQVPGQWTYYCCAQYLDVANRFMAQPSVRNRILGVQLWLYRIEGFLHWGFNFYNSELSREAIDPFAVTDGLQAFPAGDPFLVYPGKDFTPLPSIRLKVLLEAMQDLRALQCLESLQGRAAVEALVDDVMGMRITFKAWPADAEKLLQLRAEVNRRIGRAQA